MPRKFTDKQLKENIKKNLLDYMTTHNGCFGQQPDYINGAFRFEEI